MEDNNRCWTVPVGLNPAWTDPREQREYALQQQEYALQQQMLRLHAPVNPMIGGQQQIAPAQQIQRFMPEPIPEVPIGLEFLHSVPKVIMHPEDNMVTKTTHYSILDGQFGQFNRLYSLNYTLESLDTSAPFSVSCRNYMGQEVFGGRGLFNSSQRREVSIGQGQEIYGSCNSSGTSGGYEIRNSAGQVAFNVKGLGPPEYCCCCDGVGSLEYDVTGGPTPLQIVGEDVSNRRVFILRWTITFPAGMDVKMKAVWIGLIVLINHEHDSAQNRKVHRTC